MVHSLLPPKSCAGSVLVNELVEQFQVDECYQSTFSNGAVKTWQTENISFNKERNLSRVLHCDNTRRAFENTREMQASVSYISQTSRVFITV